MPFLKTPINNEPHLAQRARLRSMAPKGAYHGTTTAVCTVAAIIGLCCAVPVAQYASQTIHLPASLLFDIPLMLRGGRVVHISTLQTCVVVCTVTAFWAACTCSAFVLFGAVNAIFTARRNK